MREDRLERKQDKRSVIPVETDSDEWREGTVEQARTLLESAPGEVFDAGPDDAVQKEIA